LRQDRVSSPPPWRAAKAPSGSLRCCLHASAHWSWRANAVAKCSRFCARPRRWPVRHCGVFLPTPVPRRGALAQRPHGEPSTSRWRWLAWPNAPHACLHARVPSPRGRTRRPACSAICPRACLRPRVPVFSGLASMAPSLAFRQQSKAYKRQQNLPAGAPLLPRNGALHQFCLHAGWPQPQPPPDADPLAPCRSQ
jgi:hypothetical protein